MRRAKVRAVGRNVLMRVLRRMLHVLVQDFGTSVNMQVVYIPFYRDAGIIKRYRFYYLHPCPRESWVYWISESFCDESEFNLISVLKPSSDIHDPSSLPGRFCLPCGVLGERGAFDMWKPPHAFWMSEWEALQKAYLHYYLRSGIQYASPKIWYSYDLWYDLYFFLNQFFQLIISLLEVRGLHSIRAHKLCLPLLTLI